MLSRGFQFLLRTHSLVSIHERANSHFKNAEPSLEIDPPKLDKESFETDE